MNDCLESEKRKIKCEFLNLRNRINPVLAAAYSVSIFETVKKLPVYKKARVIMFYLSYGSEVFTDFMVNWTLGEGKTVVVPTIKNTVNIEMQAVRILKLEDACQSVYDIRQPAPNPKKTVDKDDIDLFFVPGVAFNINGYRTGYGKGYYDRWLKNVPFEKTVGLVYDFQITDRVPIEKHDVPVGVVITEKRLIQVERN